MQYYTVVLMRPEYLTRETGETYGQDIYVAQVLAPDSYKAVTQAQKEAFEADKREGLSPKEPQNYVLCVLFEGSHDPKLFGWMYGSGLEA